jgi:hypothetical protein
MVLERRDLRGNRTGVQIQAYVNDNITQSVLVERAKTVGPCRFVGSDRTCTLTTEPASVGDIIRSKWPVAQRNEALLKVLCHNIVCVIHEIHASGAVAMFPAVTACPKTLTSAQEVAGLE